MNMRIFLKRSSVILSTILISFQIITVTKVSAKEYSVDDVKKGIVEIYAGLADQNGNFYKAKCTSGFVVANNDSGAYIITSENGISLSDKEKNAIIKKHKSLNSYYGANDAIRIVIKGDVVAEATVTAKSDTENFCILNTDNIIKEKNALSLKDSSSVAQGDFVKVLGFPESTSDNLYANFDDSDVEVSEGIVSSLENGSDVDYIVHDASVTKGTSGGPMVDEDGYVIGMSDFSHSDTEIGQFCSLPINNIKEVLDNRGIFYISEQWDDSYNELLTIYNRCLKKSEDSSYKRETIQELNNVLDVVKQFLDTENPDVNDILQNIGKLKEAEHGLVKKTPKTKIIIFVLLPIIPILLVVLIRLLVINKKTKNKKIRKKKKKIRRSKEEIISKSDFQKNEQKDFDVSKQSEKSSKESDCKIDINKAKAYFYEDEKTVVLFSQNQSAEEKLTFDNRNNKAQLIQSKTGNLVKIDKAEFKLGKSLNGVDFSINNNTVSRVHAKICWIDDKYLIYDLASSNGSFVNGEKVYTGGTELHSGDKILLANELFIFEEI